MTATMSTSQNTLTSAFLTTGVPGLDEVLAGGSTRDRLYLLEGEPGTGKTILAMQFLNKGACQCFFLKKQPIIY